MNSKGLIELLFQTKGFSSCFNSAANWRGEKKKKKMGKAGHDEGSNLLKIPLKPLMSTP